MNLGERLVREVLGRREEPDDRGFIIYHSDSESQLQSLTKVMPYLMISF